MSVLPALSGASPTSERSEALAERCAPPRGGGRRPELAAELVDDAVNRARVRSAVGLAAPMAAGSPMR